MQLDVCIDLLQVVEKTCVKLVDKKSIFTIDLHQVVDNMQQICYHHAGASDANAFRNRPDHYQVTIKPAADWLQLARFYLCIRSWIHSYIEIIPATYLSQKWCILSAYPYFGIKSTQKRHIATRNWYKDVQNKKKIMLTRLFADVNSIFNPRSSITFIMAAGT